ncbi:tRNA (cytosine(32)/uridine(32)-2'-O)-methyltransferase TrmJ [Sedimenticola hydrogenitrophicus]|uniref:tRNA (cytosine(32)/uridine(32)-2'-O)-methyltransferase TrmJ n=1 Tax=Sedimenticola hydrogenitrophicus TaxID=2967975 RepID=UPI0021A6F9F9|nr:tRNA (cytosine(32)/uridine(32)-2'-O)-methyltransferase TrmJ [Sedimenticola hydrogenitrophicus]
MLKNIKIILIETTHPGNIGAAARAMKNMGLTRLCLVAPRTFPSAEATARAAGADSILEQCRVVETLDQALSGCRLVVGASARLRTVEWPQLLPRACAEQVWAEATQGEVAILFGRESSGLRNSELDRCHYLVHIPANPEYSSLNIAQALQVIAYEIYLQSLAAAEPRESELAAAAPVEAMEGFFQHLQQALLDIGFSDPRQSAKLQRRLRRLFLRARPDPEELNILRGILSAAQGRKSMRCE